MAVHGLSAEWCLEASDIVGGQLDAISSCIHVAAVCGFHLKSAVANSNLLFAIVANHVVNIHRQFPAVYFTQFTILTTCCTQFLF